MRYFYEKPDIYLSKYGMIYRCDHPLYSMCTLYTIDNKGLAVIQQRFDKYTKATYWTEIDDYLVDEIYLAKGFKNFFDIYSRKEIKGLYPTVSVRSIMWSLKMKPLRKEPWETYFDRKPIIRESNILLYESKGGK